MSKLKRWKIRLCEQILRQHIWTHEVSVRKTFGTEHITDGASCGLILNELTQRGRGGQDDIGLIFKKEITIITDKPPCEQRFLAVVDKISRETREQVEGEGYPENWEHCVIHLNQETGEMHSDGNHFVRKWIQSQFATKDKRITDLLKQVQIDNDEICYRKDKRAKYNELIMAVGMKYPDESRHETALRYIQQAERLSDVESETKTERKLGR